MMDSETNKQLLEHLRGALRHMQKAISHMDDALWIGEIAALYADDAPLIAKILGKTGWPEEKQMRRVTGQLRAAYGKIGAAIIAICEREGV